MQRKRAVRVVKGVGWVLAAGVATWLLSLLMQFIGTRTMAGQHFHPWGQPSSLLALVTIGMTIVTMFAYMAAMILWDWGDYLALLLLGAITLLCIGFGWNWVYFNATSGTPISSPGAVNIYGVITALWALVMWYVFLPDLTEYIADNY